LFVLWAVAIGLLGLSAALLGLWLRDRRAARRLEIRVSRSWLDESASDDAGLSDFALKATPVALDDARRRQRRRQKLRYSPPVSSAEITAEFPTPF